MQPINPSVSCMPALLIRKSCHLAQLMESLTEAGDLNCICPSNTCNDLACQVTGLGGPVVRRLAPKQLRTLKEDLVPWQQLLSAISGSGSLSLLSQFHHNTRHSSGSLHFNKAFCRNMISQGWYSVLTLISVSIPTPPIHPYYRSCT